MSYLSYHAVRPRTHIFGDSNGKTTLTYRRNRTPGSCPPGLPSLAVSLGKVTNNAGVLTATTVTAAEYGMQGVVFAIDGHYVSAVTAAGPYKPEIGVGRFAQRRAHVTATVVAQSAFSPYPGSKASRPAPMMDPAVRSVRTSTRRGETSISPATRAIQSTGDLKLPTVMILRRPV
jgi:hypothetical protein